MGRKNLLKTYKVIDQGDMSGALTSLITQIENVDIITYIASWAGTAPEGEIKIDVRHKAPYNVVSNEEFESAWVEIDFGVPIEVTGNSGEHSITIKNLGFTEIRARYVETSGVGALDVSIAGMVEGA